MGIISSLLDGVDVFLAWLSSALKQTVQSYCDIQTADSSTVLVAHDGALLSVVRIRGARALVGKDEFDRIQSGLLHGWQTIMSRPGHSMQIFFSYSKDDIVTEINDIYQPAMQTAKQVELNIDRSEEHTSELQSLRHLVCRL